MKNAPLVKAMQFRICAEVFDLFNTVNYDNPNDVFDTDPFGRISSAQNMRQMQLGGKLMF